MSSPANCGQVEEGERKRDRDTEYLRSLIERPETSTFWGQEYTITPRLISEVFGDGTMLIGITPLATRPNYFIVRVDSGEDFDVRDVLDDVITAAEEEYGYYQEDCEEDQYFPVVDFGIGCSWSDRFTVADLREDVARAEEKASTRCSTLLEIRMARSRLRSPRKFGAWLREEIRKAKRLAEGLRCERCRKREEEARA